MTGSLPRPPGRKTYSRLATRRRIPTEYELVSSDLHYNHPIDGSSCRPPTRSSTWYYRYREGSALQAADWERFADPRRTTYHGYTQLQDTPRERRGRPAPGDRRDRLRRSARRASGSRFLDRWYAPAALPVHGLQMLAAYVAQMAPASRITNCAAFQAARRDAPAAADRVPHRASRRRPLGRPRPTRHRTAWEDAPRSNRCVSSSNARWSTYDWGEAFMVTNVVIKPRVDRLVNQEIAGALADRQRRPDPGQYPLLARRGRALAPLRGPRR